MNYNQYTEGASSDAVLLESMHLTIAGAIHEGQIREQQQSVSQRDVQSSQLPVRRATCEELIDKATISGRVEILSDAVGQWEPRVAMLNDTVLTFFRANEGNQIINGSRYCWTDCIELGSGSHVDIDHDPLIPNGSVIKVFSPREDGLFDALIMRCLQAFNGPDKTRMWFVSITNAILRGRLLANRQALAPLQTPIQTQSYVGLKRTPSSGYVSQQQGQQSALMRASYGSGVSLSTLLSFGSTSATSDQAGLLDHRSYSRESVQTPSSLSPTTVRNSTLRSSTLTQLPELPESPQMQYYSPSPTSSPKPSSEFYTPSPTNFSIKPQPVQYQQPQQQQKQPQKISLKQRLLEAGRSLSNNPNVSTAPPFNGRAPGRSVNESPNPFGVAAPPLPMHKTKTVFAKLFPRSSRPNLSNAEELYPSPPAHTKSSLETPRSVTPDLGMRKSKSTGGGLRSSSSTPNIAGSDGGISGDERRKLDGLFLKMKKSFSKMGKDAV
ncbi:UNVERIFIED_CONTAM: hypothetical protein HDU68_011535 [Siphonaria sp. JEL0065]|nr:hypothetical protein HDU68_011535 [Siphonaria sp. JEL0065]